jgi:hypothetical protein
MIRLIEYETSHLQPMNKIINLTAIALATLALGSSATAGKPKPAKTEADYFPLRVGDSWTYRNSEQGGYTLKVLSEEPQQGAPNRYVVEFLSGVKIHNVFSKVAGWVLLHAESYPEHEGLKATYEPPKQYLPNPLVAGQKWEWTGKDSTLTERHESNRVAGFESITVPAGKFRAMKVVSEIAGGAAQTRTYWYAAGVGLVKSTTEAGQTKYGSELTDYSFKKKKVAK